MRGPVRGCLLDLSGTVHVGDQLLPGAAEAIARLREANLALRFVSNTSRLTCRELVRRLREAGLEIAPEEIFTAPLAAKAWLEARGLYPYLLVHPDLLPEFVDMHTSNPSAVLVADAGEAFTQTALNQAFRLLMEGAPLVATGVNRYFRDGDMLSLDAGPFVRALEYAAEVEAVVVGKPAESFFHAAVTDMGLEPARTLMIGDDADSDVAGAIRAGLAGTLVQTGKYQDGDETRLPENARVAASLAEAVDFLLDG